MARQLSFLVHFLRLIILFYTLTCNVFVVSLITTALAVNVYQKYLWITTTYLIVPPLVKGGSSSSSTIIKDATAFAIPFSLFLTILSHYIGG